MCGFAGFFAGTAPSASTLAQASAMLEALKPRGPDAQHIVAWSAAGECLRESQDRSQPVEHALIHARLAIIDPTPGADQPMASVDGKIWLCYNGEIYGWESEARLLAQSGVTFCTRSDTEFILHGYEAWGMEGLLSRLRGMYAFALYDARIGKVFLARDPMGKKPLLYRVTSEQGLAFASTLRALLPVFADTHWRFSSDAIDAYLAHRTVPAPLTLVEGVQRLPNGHWAEYDVTSTSFAIHKQPESPPDRRDWLAVLDESVSLRTVADRPVGLFLSGGIDSAVIGSRLAALGQPLRAFTAGFPGSAFDESGVAASVASRFCFEHRVVPVPNSIRDDFAAIVAALDEPFADPSAIPLWYLAREATRDVKVVLSGDGGDELFAGYKRYRKHLRSRWRRGLRYAFRRRAELQPRGLDKLKLELSLDWREAYSLRFSGFNPAQRAYLQPTRTSSPAVYWRMPDVTPGQSALNCLLAIDMDNYLPEYILRKGDLTTMAHGLELRSPLLDTRFHAAICALPDDLRFTLPPKKLLARALPDDLAASLFDQKKRGFNPPLTHWLQVDLRDRIDGLGKRLEQLSKGSLSRNAVDEFSSAYLHGNSSLAEGLLQLLVLDESLTQLAALPGWQP